MPKQITKALCGLWERNARGRCAIILVIGVMAVMPIPFTSNSFCSLDAPAAVTVAVLSCKTSRGQYMLSKLLVVATRSSATAEMIIALHGCDFGLLVEGKSAGLPQKLAAIQGRAHASSA